MDVYPECWTNGAYALQCQTSLFLNLLILNLIFICIFSFIIWLIYHNEPNGKVVMK